MANTLLLSNSLQWRTTPFSHLSPPFNLRFTPKPAKFSPKCSAKPPPPPNSNPNTRVKDPNPLGLVVDTVLNALKKPALALVLTGLLLASDPNSAWAASGGRVGGRAFSSPSPSRSYSSGRAGPSFSYSTPYYAPSPFGGGFYAGPAFGFGLGAGSSFLFLLAGAAAFLLVSGFLSDRSEGSVLNATEKTSVLKLQVGLLGMARSLQRDLNRIAETADTSTPEGLNYVLTETMLALLRNPDYCISAYSSTDVKRSIEEGEKRFNQLSIEERGKFDEETLVNVNSIRRQTTKSLRSNGFRNEYIVVTILVAAEGVHKLPPINESKDLKDAFQKLGSIPSRQTMCSRNAESRMLHHRRTVTVLSKHILKPFSPFFNPTPTTTAAGAAAMGEQEPPKAYNGVARSIEEPDVGILCYISKLPGFRGILKQRYSDFIVNEVDLEGNAVHLTSMDVPQEMVQKRELKLPEQSDKSYTSEIESFRSLAGDSDADQLKDFIEKINSGSEDSGAPFVLSPSSDKIHRTAVHNFFKEKMNFLVTDTVDGPDPSSKCIRVRLASGGNQSRGKFSRKRKDRGGKPYDSRGSEDWPENLGKFLRFHLYKENKDTQEALRVIGKMLGIQPRSFGFAGTKDKRAVTTQRVTLFKVRARRLASLNERLIGIKVGDFSYAKDGLNLGQLLGNRFTITLRGVVAESEDTIRAALSDMATYGFINYFGLQRFGSGTVPTHRIGSALLRGEWKEAVNMILDPRDGEWDEIKKIREYYKETNDVDGTLRQLPHNMVAERAILQCLKKNPGNYLQALKAIPRTLRMMYVHSYQSFLWNNAASIRVQKYGAEKVVLGDLVYSKEDGSQDDIPGVPAIECEDDATIDEVNGSHVDELSEVDLQEDRCQPVKAIDAEDLLKGNYTTEDIVLPLPGSRATYPKNDIADIYHDLAKKDDISLTECKHNVKEFSITSMTGGYRRVFQKPIGFEWEILKYTDGNKPLAETDMDKINKPKSVESSELQSESKPSDTRESSDVQETQTALKLCFTLPASSYATMAIREILKTSTSVAFHKALNS